MQRPMTGHDPVLLHEVLDSLSLAPGKTIVDCTLGRAGHAREIAARLGPTGLLLGLDVDPNNLTFAQSQLDGVPCEVRLFHANFAELSDVLREVGRERVDGMLADLGISTNQLFDDRYGLSFAQDMPLDMRIDPRLDKSAAHFVNSMREEDLANVLYELAQERYSRRIARKIADARRISPINTTERLAELVRSAIPRVRAKPSSKRGGNPRERIDPATKTFMALRMAVNREIPNLAALLEQAPQHLNPAGRLAVISFHSTEDRLVKQAMRIEDERGVLKGITRKPVTPSDDELARNPRSRSAKLRVAEKTVAGC